MENHGTVADLYVYITLNEAWEELVGKAWLGTVCKPDSARQMRVSLNAYFSNSDQYTGTVSTC